MSTKRQFWFQHIEAWQQSQLSQSEYARQHGLSIKSFSYYRRRFVQEHQQSLQEPSVPLLPVSVVPEEPGGFRIELAPGFDSQALQAVLQILEAA